MEVDRAVQAVEQEFISVKDAAEMLAVKRQTVYTAIRENRLAAERILGNLVVRRADVLAYKKRTDGLGPLGGRPKKLRRPPGRPRKQKEAEE